MDAHDLNILPTAWWALLIIGIAFVIGGLATALNQIQAFRDHRVRFPKVEHEPKLVLDPNGPYPRCKPGGGVIESIICVRCGKLYDASDPNACAASDPCTRWRIDWVRVEGDARS